MPNPTSSEQPEKTDVPLGQTPLVAEEFIVFVQAGSAPGAWSFPCAHLATVHCWLDSCLEFSWRTQNVSVICDHAANLLQRILAGETRLLQAKFPPQPDSIIRGEQDCSKAAEAIATQGRPEAWGPLGGCTHGVGVESITFYRTDSEPQETGDGSAAPTDDGGSPTRP